MVSVQSDYWLAYIMIIDIGSRFGWVCRSARSRSLGRGFNIRKRLKFDYHVFTLNLVGRW